MLHVNEATVIARSLSRVNSRLFVVERNTASVLAAASPLWRDRMYLRAMPFLYRRADGVFAVSKGVSDDLARRGVKSTVAPNPVITHDFAERAARPVAIPWPDDGTPMVVAATRLVEEKDAGVLIEAVGRVHRDRPVRLIIAGDGPERPRLEALAQRAGLADDVAFLGFVPDAVPYLARGTVVAHSSRVEGLGHVLVEGLAVGAQVVATDCPSGPREVLADGRYGRLVPVGDVDAFARALAAALDEGRRAAPPESWHRFRVDVAVDRWMELLGLR